MRPEYITYKDVSTYSLTVSVSVPAMGVFASVAQQIVTPVKQLLILEAQIAVFVFDTASQEYLPDAAFQSRWQFITPNASGLVYTGKINEIRFTCKSGMNERWSVMREVAAAEPFSFIDGANSFNCDRVPPTAWTGIANITMFYVLMN